MVEEVTIDNDVSAAIIPLLCYLPEKFQGLWWTVEEYCDMLTRSGLKDEVVWALRRPLLSGVIGVVVHLTSEDPGYIGTLIHPGEVKIDM
jgi:hypothetical protein